MPIRPKALLAHDFETRRQSYDERDAILYALGIGLGHEPGDASDLRYLYERDLRVFPTFAVTLASPGMWLRDERFGVDFSRLVHLEHDARFHAPLTASGEVSATARVESLTDRGEGKGAVLVLERCIFDAAGAPLCTMHQTLLLRGDGGFGGPPPARSVGGIPDRVPDLIATQAISSRAALIYRLSGDWNPLHVDPSFAAEAGFDRPILHGLGNYGTACAMLCRATGIDPGSIARFGCRFSGIVYPGDTLEMHIWKAGKGFAFRASANGRPALNDGLIEVANRDG
jgi:acyl dehydratase